MVSQEELLRDRYGRILRELTSNPDPQDGRFHFRVNFGPLCGGVRVPLSTQTEETVGREIAAERWREAQRAYRASDGFSLRLGEDRSLQVFSDGRIYFHRQIGNATIGAALPVPFPDLFADIFALLRFAERAYPRLAGECRTIDVRCSLVNIYERPLDFPLDLEDQMRGAPRREGDHSVPKWFSDPAAFEIGRDDPILVTRTILEGLFWITGYQGFEPYLSRWGRNYERPAPLPPTSDASPPRRRRRKRFKYDVAISFAGSERAQAEQLATLVRDAGFEVFYDGFRGAELWGKNLTEHLDSVYRKDSRYCVVFVSPQYRERMWTARERQSALARSLDERGQDYLLPIIVEPTELPGFLPTVGHVSLSDHSIRDIAELLIEKLRS